MTQYKAVPSIVINRDDGGVLELFQSETNPNAYLPVLNSRPFDLTQELQNQRPSF